MYNVLRLVPNGDEATPVHALIAKRPSARSCIARSSALKRTDFALDARELVATSSDASIDGGRE